MVGLTRLYVEPTKAQPETMKGDWMPAVQDFPDRQMAASFRRQYTLQGYSVVMIDL